MFPLLNWERTPSNATVFSSIIFNSFALASRFHLMESFMRLKRKGARILASATSANEITAIIEITPKSEFMVGPPNLLSRYFGEFILTLSQQPDQLKKRNPRLVAG